MISRAIVRLSRCPLNALVASLLLACAVSVSAQSSKTPPPTHAAPPAPAVVRSVPATPPVVRSAPVAPTVVQSAPSARPAQASPSASAPTIPHNPATINHAVPGGLTGGSYQSGTTSSYARPVPATSGTVLGNRPLTGISPINARESTFNNRPLGNTVPVVGSSNRLNNTGLPINSPTTHVGLGADANQPATHRGLNSPDAGSGSRAGSSRVPNGAPFNRPFATSPGRVAFTGRPAPIGAHEIRTANGSAVLTRPNGARSDFHDARRSMEVHENLNGSRRITVERPNNSRIFAERGDFGYVQHPYVYHGQEFGQRTYYDHGHAYDRYYSHYEYRGQRLDVYAPTRFYAPGFYGWASRPWSTPVAYSWGWSTAPWYGAYGSYFAPEPVYPSASLWLTDYLIGSSLQAAYDERLANAPAEDATAAGSTGGPGWQTDGPTVMTPEVKSMIAMEVQREVGLENQEAAANAQRQDIDPGGSSIARLLSDDAVHVFVVNSALDLVTNPDGEECPVSQGDVLKIAEPPPPSATSAYAVVLSSKGWQHECQTATAVSVAFTDLQEMQNHMRATIDAGMDDLQRKEGQGGIPSAPPLAKAPPTRASFAAVAPPPDPNVAREIAAQTQAANQAEQEVATSTIASGPADSGFSDSVVTPSTTTITLGETIDQVTAAIGHPRKVVDLGTKKIYVYPDLKITFTAGKVSTVE